MGYDFTQIKGIITAINLNNILMKKFLSIISCVFYLIVNAQISECDKLSDAIIQNNSKVFKQLLSKNINCISQSGNSPLGIASSRGDVEFVQTLLKNKANPNIKQFYNGKSIGTPLFNALSFCEQKLEPKLIDIAQMNSEKKQNKVKTCNNDKKDCIVKLLINSGADVKMVDDDKTTSLMIAAMNNRSNILKFLIDNGVNINAQNNFKNSALIYATNNNDYNSVKILVLSGADISIKDNDGKTALDIAKENNFEKIVKVLSPPK